MASSQKLTVHMIGNAHLDPVWLWDWSSGLDEAIATAWSAVKRLEEYPEFIFTRSDAWFHEAIEDVQPELFAKIKNYIDTGRWQLVGGWYIQPDCNLPTAESFRKQAEIGNGYFLERFQKRATVSYNVDSFGHAGSLPSLLRQTGYDSYVFMRPGPGEKELPACLFRWQDTQTTDTVTAFRIANAYCSINMDMFKANLEQTIQNAPAGIPHTMCFYGVGDHGGGPTKQQIEYILAHRHYAPDVELIFSHPRAFFDAVAPFQNQLPLVKGELQMHAVGCYSVVHDLKQQARRVEHELLRTEKIMRCYPLAEASTAPQLRKAWQYALFNQFHDTLGGSSVAVACRDALRQLGYAWTIANDITHRTIRRVRFGDHRPEGEVLGILNADTEPFYGYVEAEMWNGRANAPFILRDSQHREIPYQRICPQMTVSDTLSRVLIPLTLPPQSETLLQCLRHQTPAAVAGDLQTSPAVIANAHVSIEPGSSGLRLSTPAGSSLQLSFEVLADLTDTWSHGITRYDGETLGNFHQTHHRLDETGPLRAAFAWQGEFDKSAIALAVRVYHNNPWVELCFRVHWHMRQSLLKLCLTPHVAFSSRLDGIPGSFQTRPLNGYEFPFHDWTQLTIAAAPALSVVSPDIFALDVQPENCRLTLLRSAVYSHHDPKRLTPGQSYQYTDQGEHEFRLFLNLSTSSAPADLQRFARQLQQPPVVWDLPFRDPEAMC